MVTVTASSPPAPRPETILVVDDEEDVRAVVRVMLEREGYTVLDTGDPQQPIRTA